MPVLSAAAPALEPVPWLAVAPFVLLLLSIAVLPLVAHHWWESNRNRGLVSAVLGVPVAAWLLLGPAGGAGWLADAGLEYAAFLALLGSLFVVSGGVHLRGSLAGTPIVNTAIRTNEAEADIFGLNASRQPDGFAEVALLLGEYRKLEPTPLEEWIFFDHPSGMSRIRMAMKWKKEHLGELKPAP